MHTHVHTPVMLNLCLNDSPLPGIVTRHSYMPAVDSETIKSILTMALFRSMICLSLILSLPFKIFTVTCSSHVCMLHPIEKLSPIVLPEMSMF